MAEYTQMSLEDQITILEQEKLNTQLLGAKAQMWSNAITEFNKGGQIIEKETDKIEAAWTDIAGTDFVARARNTRRVIGKWERNLEQARPDKPLTEIASLIPEALNLAQKNKELFEQQWAALSKQYAMDLTPVANRTTYQEAQAAFRVPSGKMMDRIAVLYEQAGEAVTQATSGGNYEGIQSRAGQGGGNIPPLGSGAAAGGGGGGGVPAGIGAGGGGAGVPAGVPAGGGGVGLPTGGGGVPAGGGLPTGGGGGAPVGGIDPQTGLPQTGADGLPQTAPTGVDPQDVGSVGGGGGTQDPELSGGLGAAPITTPTLPAGGGVGLTGGGTGLGTTPILPITGGGTGGGTGTGAGINPITGGTNPIGGGPGGGGGGGTGIGPIGGGGLGGISPITGGGSGSGSNGGLDPITGGSSGGSSGGSGGLGPVGGTGAGVKVPGVSLGGGSGIGSIGGGGGAGIGPIGSGGVGGASGSGTIPAAAAPFEAPATAGPSGAAPTAASAAPTTAGATSTGGGAPGMMPPMGMGGGGAGAGGAGVRPGSGAAARAGSNRNRRKDVVTPGLPVMLSGKAGQADLNAFAGRGRKQVEESDVPTTVQLIDEDLWQVEQKPAADERVVSPAPVRRAH